MWSKQDARRHSCYWNVFTTLLSIEGGTRQLLPGLPLSGPPEPRFGLSYPTPGNALQRDRVFSVTHHSLT